MLELFICMALMNPVEPQFTHPPAHPLRPPQKVTVDQMKRDLVGNKVQVDGENFPFDRGEHLDIKPIYQKTKSDKSVKWYAVSVLAEASWPRRTLSGVATLRYEWKGQRGWVFVSVTPNVMEITTTVKEGD